MLLVFEKGDNDIDSNVCNVKDTHRWTVHEM